MVAAQRFFDVAFFAFAELVLFFVLFAFLPEDFFALAVALLFSFLSFLLLFLLMDELSFFFFELLFFFFDTVFFFAFELFFFVLVVVCSLLFLDFDCAAVVSKLMTRTAIASTAVTINLLK